MAFTDYLPFFEAGGNLISNANTNRTNLRIARENLAMQKEINSQNIAFQQAENEITRQREDNAVQRAALDMERAGLSKTLAAGSPASSAALSAPQAQMTKLDYQHQRLMQGVDLANAFIGLKKGVAEVNKLDAETEGINTSNEYIADKAKSEVALNEARASDYEASVKLSSIYGENALKKIDAEIEHLRASTDLTYEQIAKSVAERNHIAKEDEYMIEIIARANVETRAMVHNLNFSEDANLRTTDSLPTMLSLPVGYFGKGLNDAVIRPLFSFIGNGISNLSNLVFNR